MSEHKYYQCGYIIADKHFFLSRNPSGRLTMSMSQLYALQFPTKMLASEKLVFSDLSEKWERHKECAFVLEVTEYRYNKKD